MEVWGVVNVTPDSFSDGGDFFSHDAAIAHGRELRAGGATVLDIGGESTRPGALPVGTAEELRRVVPVIEALAADGALVSADTYRADVAEAALAVGARIVNDVSGGLEDPRIFEVVAASDAQLAISHWRGPSADMYRMAQYEHVGAEIAVELSQRVETARAAGVRDEQIILDPGIGFAKTPEQSWAALRELREIEALGFPVLVGVSRKRFLTSALGGDPSRERRDAASAVISVLAQQIGAYGVRVHDVPTTVDALAVLRAMQGEGDHSRAACSLSRRPENDALSSHPGASRERVREPDERAGSNRPETLSDGADRHRGMLDDVTGAIELTGLRVFGHHGVLDFEREDGQEFVIDLSLSLSMIGAAETDDVRDTVHYGELADRVAAIVAGEPVNLIETLAHRIADAVLEDHRVRLVVVAVHKPHAPIQQRFDDVVVKVIRHGGRDDAGSR